MKSLILLMLLTVAVFGQITWSDGSRPTRVECIEGYKYVIAQSATAISITQMYRKGIHNNSPAQPIKCKGN